MVLVLDVCINLPRILNNSNVPLIPSAVTMEVVGLGYRLKEWPYSAMPVVDDEQGLLQLLLKEAVASMLSLATVQFAVDQAVSSTSMQVRFGLF